MAAGWRTFEELWLWGANPSFIVLGISILCHVFCGSLRSWLVTIYRARYCCELCCKWSGSEYSCQYSLIDCTLVDSSGCGSWWGCGVLCMNLMEWLISRWVVTLICSLRWLLCTWAGWFSFIDTMEENLSIWHAKVLNL